MPLSNRRTFTQYLIEQRRRFPRASGELNALLLDVSVACKAMARSVAFGALGDPALRHIGAPAEQGLVNVQGEEQKPQDLIGNEVFVRTAEWGGNLAGMASEEMAEPYQIPPGYHRGKYLLVFDPLDGSSSIDVNVAVGSIFSILRLPDAEREQGRDVTEADFLQPGVQQVAAGYAVYGPATLLILTVGNGVVGFTLDPTLGEFKLTHPDIRIPEDTQEFAINSSNSRFWEPPVKRYVDECLAGRSGPRGKDFNTRWIASLVAEAHRMTPEFHPRRSATARRYGYLVGTDEAALSPFRRRYEWAVRHPLDADALHGEAQAVLGEHTFRAFAVAHTAPVDDHHRCVIQHAAWVPRDGGWVFEVQANRFLHHMVRFLVGTMIDVAQGRRPRGTLARLLVAPDNAETSAPAPARGLSLRAVTYPESCYAVGE